MQWYNLFSQYTKKKKEVVLTKGVKEHRDDTNCLFLWFVLQKVPVFLTAGDVFWDKLKVKFLKKEGFCKGNTVLHNKQNMMFQTPCRS